MIDHYRRAWVNPAALDAINQGSTA